MSEAPVASPAASPVSGELLSAQGIPLPSIGQLIRWGMGHVELIETVGDAAYDLSQATSFKQRGEIVGGVLPPLGAAVDDLIGPSISAVSESDAKKLKGELLATLQSRPRGLAVGAQAREGKWLDRTIALIQLLLPLLMK